MASNQVPYYNSSSSEGEEEVEVSQPKGQRKKKGL